MVGEEIGLGGGEVLEPFGVGTDGGEGAFGGALEGGELHGGEEGGDGGGLGLVGHVRFAIGA